VNRALWVVQVFLALAFLATGAMKLMLPIEALVEQMPLPGAFIRFLGAIEVLGAIGLIVPSLARIRPGLTPLAAAGLVIIMIGAMVFTVITMDATMALAPLVLGILAAFVAYGRWRLEPIAESSHAPAELQTSGRY
jgi:DoxX-like protein